MIVCPGGLEHGGGIGRQMGYFLQAMETSRSGVGYRMVDSRGPWFLGACRLCSALAVGYLAGAILSLLAAGLSTEPHIAHINIAGRGSTIRKAVLVAVARLVGLRYLLHVHDYDYAAEYRRRGPLMQSVIRSMFRKSETVLVLGARDQERLTALLRLPKDQIAVLHNGVPDPQPDPARARPPGAPCHLLFLGDLSVRKGVPELLRALASPAMAGAPWRATLAGGGAVEDYRRDAAALGIAHRIAFPGWLDQAGVRALCADADVVVLPSHAEGMAMAVLEGLSHGIAVVTTPVGAHEEVIEPNVSGIMVPPGDVPALAEALLRVIGDAALRDRLRAGARRRFLEKFNVRVYAERLGYLHARLLTDSRQTGGAIKREQTS